MLSLSPFQQGHRVDGKGQGVEGSLAYAFSLKLVEAVRYLFCFPLCKGGVFIDGNPALLPGWLGGVQGVETQNAVGRGSFPTLYRSLLSTL